MVHGSWFMVHGSRFMVHGSWFIVHSSWKLRYGTMGKKAMNHELSTMNFLRNSLHLGKKMPDEVAI